MATEIFVYTQNGAFKKPMDGGYISVLPEDSYSYSIIKKRCENLVFAASKPTVSNIVNKARNKRECLATREIYFKICNQGQKKGILRILQKTRSFTVKAKFLSANIARVNTFAIQIFF